MSAFAEPIAWAIVGITQVGLYVGAALCVIGYMEAHKAASAADVSEASKKMADGKATLYLLIAIVLAILAIVMSILLWCGFSALKIAIDVIDAAADFIAGTKRIILVPVVYFIFQLIVFITWMFCMACIWSTGEISVKSIANPTN
jgi:hypothetical protein